MAASGNGRSRRRLRSHRISAGASTDTIRTLELYAAARSITRQSVIALELVYPQPRLSRGFEKRVPIPVEPQSPADEGSSQVFEIAVHVPLAHYPLRIIMLLVRKTYCILLLLSWAPVLLAQPT